MGLPRLRPASKGASTTSFVVPMPSWRRVIDTARTTIRSAAAPAMAATAPTTIPSRTDGNGCVSRIQPTSRRPTPVRPSDVDELGEVLDQVLDEAIAPVGDLRADPRDERELRD